MPAITYFLSAHFCKSRIQENRLWKFLAASAIEKRELFFPWNPCTASAERKRRVYPSKDYAFFRSYRRVSLSRVELDLGWTCSLQVRFRRRNMFMKLGPPVWGCLARIDKLATGEGGIFDALFRYSRKNKARSGRGKKVMMWRTWCKGKSFAPQILRTFLLFILFTFLSFSMCLALPFRSEDLIPIPIPIPIPSNFDKNSSTFDMKSVSKKMNCKMCRKTTQKILKWCKNLRCKGMQISNLVELEKC